MQHRSSAKWLILTAACLAGGLASKASLAGSKSTNQVSISGLTASGSVGSARNSADNNQRIECSVLMDTSPPPNPGSNPSVFCLAVDSTGAMLSCLTENQGFFPVVRSINSTSYLTFTTDASSQCQYIQVNPSSKYTVPVH